MPVSACNLGMRFWGVSNGGKVREVLFVCLNGLRYIANYFINRCVWYFGFCVSAAPDSTFVHSLQIERILCAGQEKIENG